MWQLKELFAFVEADEKGGTKPVEYASRAWLKMSPGPIRALLRLPTPVLESGSAVTLYADAVEFDA